MSRPEQVVQQELQEAERCAVQVGERLARVQGHIDNLRRELCDTMGAHSQRMVAVR